MTEHHLRSAAPPEPPDADTGLACLVMLARFHNVAVSPEQLAHEYLNTGQLFTQPELQLAAKQLGLKAKGVRSSFERVADASE